MIRGQMGMAELPQQPTFLRHEPISGLGHCRRVMADFDDVF